MSDQRSSDAFWKAWIDVNPDGGGPRPAVVGSGYFDWSASAAMRRQLELHEGVVLKPYTDTVGKLCIGTGRNLTDVGISQAENDLMLSNDIASAQESLDAHISWWRDLDHVRQRVMLDMCFNMGWGDGKQRGLSTFHNTLLAIHQHRFDEAADGMAGSLWARQVKARAERLIQMMRTGDLPEA